jgi:type I restriction enzyme R subunit
VSDGDLRALVSLVLTQNPDVNLSLLLEFFPETAGHLDVAIRAIIFTDVEAMSARFSEFVRVHPGLTAKQIRFLDIVVSLNYL